MTTKPLERSCWSFLCEKQYYANFCLSPVSDMYPEPRNSSLRDTLDKHKLIMSTTLTGRRGTTSQGLTKNNTAQMQHTKPNMTLITIVDTRSTISLSCSRVTVPETCRASGMSKLCAIVCTPRILETWVALCVIVRNEVVCWRAG
jgi:hypothetical protein